MTAMTEDTIPTQGQSQLHLPDDALVLNEIIINPDYKWQVYNCKIVEQTVTQEAHLPFIYHYDTLSDELKSAHPLTPALLMRFNEPMSAADAAQLLALPIGTITAPWQVKVIGTLVLFCESLQVAVRLRFTNTAKALEPIYIADKKQAWTQAMRSWHFFGEVFVLNKYSKPLAVLPVETLSTKAGTDTDASLAPNEIVKILPQDPSYQLLPSIYGVAILSELDTNKTALPQLNEAIQARLG